MLLIPATDASIDTESYREYGTGRFLARGFMKYGWDLYAPDAKTCDNPYVSPLRATVDQLKGLPPALVITAENDPLRDEDEAYARKLKAAGVSVDAVRYKGTIHDFVLLNALRDVPSTKAAIQQVSEGVRLHLTRRGGHATAAARDAAVSVPDERHHHQRCCAPKRRNLG